MRKSWLGLQRVWHLLRVIVPLIVGVGLLVLIVAWLAGTFGEKIPPGRSEGGIRTLAGEPTDTVHEVTKQYVEEAIGTLKAASRTAISAKVLATIEEVHVTAGDQVAEGEELITLDGKQLETQLNQALQGLAAAEAKLKEAESNYERIQQLVSRNAISRARFQEATRNLEVTRAEKRRADEAVAEAKVMRSYATITAPKGGRIVDRLAEPGDTARPGEPLIVLYDATSLRLEAPVLEHLAVKLRVGDKLMVYVDALERAIESTVDEIVPQADAPSRSFLVKASLPRSPDLYEGMFGRLRIPAGERRHLCLATDAIQQVGQLQFVDVVLDNNRLQRRYITTGQLGMPGRVEVLSGLKAEERVVLRDGDAKGDSEQ